MVEDGEFIRSLGSERSASRFQLSGSRCQLSVVLITLARDNEGVCYFGIEEK